MGVSENSLEGTFQLLFAPYFVTSPLDVPPGTTAGKCLAWNENSLKFASLGVFKHTLAKDHPSMLRSVFLPGIARGHILGSLAEMIQLHCRAALLQA